MSRSLSQKGFALPQAILLIILVAIIGGTGYFVYNANKKTGDTLDAAAKVAQSTSSKNAKKAKSNVAKEPQPIYSSDGYDWYDVADLAQTTDQKQIAAVVKQECITDTIQFDSKANSGNVVVIGGKSIFTDASTFAASGGFARLSAMCSLKPVTPHDGGARYTLQKEKNSWKILFAGQMGPNCSEVDNKGIPAVVVESCYDTVTSQDRAPKL